MKFLTNRKGYARFANQNSFAVKELSCTWTTVTKRIGLGVSFVLNAMFF